MHTKEIRIMVRKTEERLTNETKDNVNIREDRQKYETENKRRKAQDNKREEK